MSVESSLTWQKLTVLVAILGIAVPATVRYCWNIVLPSDYLTYEVTHTTRVDSHEVASVSAFNGGRDPQRNVVLYLPSQAAPEKETLVEVTSSSRGSLGTLFSSDPRDPLSKFAHETGYQIPMGTIEPEEGVRVTFVSAWDRENLPFAGLRLSDARVESSSMSAIEADGPRSVRFSEDAHSLYLQASPYILAMLTALLGLAWLISIIHGLFFDSPEKQMSRYWRLMDQLQEQIDKERRYK